MTNTYPQSDKPITKHFISSEELTNISRRLAIEIYKSQFTPDYIIGIWRGGTPVGIAVQELLSYLGIASDHISIRTSSYTGIAQKERHVNVHGLHYIIENVNSEDQLLIVDDVFDTGGSIVQVIKDIKNACRKNAPTIKIATPYFKPSHNQTNIKPDYYIQETDKWLVFPHELDGLTEEEIAEHKGNLIEHIRQVKDFRR